MSLPDTNLSCPWRDLIKDRCEYIPPKFNNSATNESINRRWWCSQSSSSPRCPITSSSSLKQPTSQPSIDQTDDEALQQSFPPSSSFSVLVVVLCRTSNYNFKPSFPHYPYITPSTLAASSSTSPMLYSNQVHNYIDAHTTLSVYARLAPGFQSFPAHYSVPQ